MAYVNKQEGTRSPGLLALSQEILFWVEANLSSLRAVHLRGLENILADYLSRNTVKEGEWELKAKVFALIMAR